MAQEVVKFVVAGVFLWASGSWMATVSGWTVSMWMLVAGIPAAIYVVQNYCALMAYQNLSPVTFNVLNQTKTLSAALCCFLVMGRRQSSFQIVALGILLMAALVIENVLPLPRLRTGKKTTQEEAVEIEASTISAEEQQKKEDRKMHIISGVIPVLMASFLSGLAGALSQKSLQNMGRNSYLFTMELSAASVLFLVGSLLLGSPDGKRIAKDGFFQGWNYKTCIPVVTNALGGILVGLVTKYAGSVRKGFALIFGLLLSGVLQSWLSKDDGVSPEQIVGGVLAAISLWMHAKFVI